MKSNEFVVSKTYNIDVLSIGLSNSAINLDIEGLETELDTTTIESVEIRKTGFKNPKLIVEFSVIYNAKTRDLETFQFGGKYIANVELEYITDGGYTELADVEFNGFKLAMKLRNNNKELSKLIHIKLQKLAEKEITISFNINETS